MPNKMREDEMSEFEFIEAKPKTQRKNYQLMTDRIVEEAQKSEHPPKLMLHSCCAPCSCYVIDYLANYFKITVFFYNPNIYPKAEYEKRKETQIKYNSLCETKYPIDMIEGDYDTRRFYKAVKGHEHDKEGGERCQICYNMRMEETAKLAEEMGYDYFTSCLSISPHKDSQVINELGARLEEKYDVKYLYSDFKKKNGFKRSIEICNACKLYRQNYCGCEFSLRNMQETGESTI